MCPVCESSDAIRPSGFRYSTFSERKFHYGICQGCGTGLVLDPRTDFEEIYSESYYMGLGADPLVDYLGGDAARALEFNGLAKFGLRLLGKRGRWLDFGGGTGEFAKFLRTEGWQAWALDDGWADGQLVQNGLKWNGQPESMDVVSAIEVVEHLIDPAPALALIRDSLRPGGYFFITTGNLSRSPGLARWRYAAVPEVHVTFWTPSSWESMLRKAGFEVVFGGRLDPSVTQYKIIKNLPRRIGPLLVGAGPLWRPLASMVDRYRGVSDFAVGRKPL